MIIGGPTCSNKSHLAMKIAEKLNGEIICADARQVYSRMPIASTSPVLVDYLLIPHHGFEQISPRNMYNAGEFSKDTCLFIREIQSRGKIPIIVGGSGFYLHALMFGFNTNCANNIVRKEIGKRFLDDLYKIVKLMEIKYTEKINKYDHVRIKRVLEIYLTENLQVINSKSEIKLGYFFNRYILLSINPVEFQFKLYFRVDRMLNNQIILESINISMYLDKFSLLKKYQRLGYFPVLKLIASFITKNQLRKMLFLLHGRYFKQQLVWFKKDKCWERSSFKIFDHK